MSYDISTSFPGKEKQEAVFVFARPFWLAFVPTAFIFVFVISFALIAQAGISWNWFGDFGDTASNAIVLFLGLFQIFALIIFFSSILDFYYDMLIVTDRRIVDINQEQLFYRSISELNLEDVEDVKSSVAGFFQTIFNYGTVTIQTAGEHENFVAQNFAHPREIASIISDLSKQAKEGTFEHSRMPEGRILGVISNQQITDFKELQKLGAIMTDDRRRFENTPTNPN